MEGTSEVRRSITREKKMINTAIIIAGIIIIRIRDIGGLVMV
jgi:hypothetical protein